MIHAKDLAGVRAHNMYSRPKMKLWMVVWRRRRRRRGNDGCSHNIPPALPFFPLIYELKAKHPSSDDPRNGDHCRNQRALPLAQWWMSRWKKERERGYGRSKEILGKIESWRNQRKCKGENLRWKNEETKNKGSTDSIKVTAQIITTAAHYFIECYCYIHMFLFQIQQMPKWDLFQPSTQVRAFWKL